MENYVSTDNRVKKEGRKREGKEKRGRKNFWLLLSIFIFYLIIG